MPRECRKPGNRVGAKNNFKKMKTNPHPVFFISAKSILIASLLISFSHISHAKNTSINRNLLRDERALLYNESFSNFIYEFSKNSLDFYVELKNNNSWNTEFVNKFVACTSKEEIQTLCKFNNLSYETVVRTNIYPVANYVNFLFNNPSYLKVDEGQQASEFGAIITKICTDKSFRGTNSSAPLVKAISGILNYGKTKCGNVSGRLFNLTWDELGGCLINGLGTFIASNLSAIRTAWNLLTGNFSLGNVISVLELAFPEFKAGAAIVMTAACIIREWIW